MKETAKGDALSVIEVMEQKGWTKEEIRELVNYLDQRERILRGRFMPD